MNIKRSYLAALSLAAMLSFAGAAGAQETANAPQKQVVAPKCTVLVEGRIKECIGTDQVAGYGIGDPMLVTLVFDLTPDEVYRKLHPDAPPPTVLPPLPGSTGGPHPRDPSVAAHIAQMQVPTMLELPLIEVEGLKMAAVTGKVTDQASDVEVYKSATVDTYPLPNGGRRVVVTLIVTQYITTQKEADGKTTKRQADVTMDFSWAISRLPDGQPDWHSAQTPTLTFGIHETADPNQTVMIPGDEAPKVSPKAPATGWLLYGSWLFLIPVFACLVMLSVARARRQREASVNERVWLEIGEVFKRAAAGGAFEVQHYQHIFGILRSHLQFYSITTTQALERVAASDVIDHEAGDYVFHQETVLFDSEKTISGEERAELFRNIAILVPIDGKELAKTLALAGELIPGH